MASWYTHVTGGLIVAWAIILGIHYGLGYLSISAVDTLVLTALIAFYSLLPDIDHPSSKIVRVFYGTALSIFVVAGIDSFYYDIPNVVGVWLFAIGAILFGATFYISQDSGLFIHRGFSHTWVFGIITVLPLLLIGLGRYEYIIGSFIGYWSHLLLDKIPFKLLSKRPA